MDVTISVDGKHIDIGRNHEHVAHKAKHKFDTFKRAVEQHGNDLTDDHNDH